MRIPLLGRNGQVGWELQRSLSPLGQVLALGSRGQDYCGDLSDLQGLAATVQRFAPEVIFNAAAYTAMDKAESEPDRAPRVNAEAPRVLAAQSLKLNALRVHYSTDYQLGAPTSAQLIADVTAHAIRAMRQRPQLGGIYHLAAEGETTWYRYARFVLEQSQAAGIQLNVAPVAFGAIATTAHSTPAKRPCNSRLNTQKPQNAFSLSLPKWQAGVARMLMETLEK